jgi:hypothetical protein
VGDGRVIGRLGTGLGLLSVAINVVVDGAVQAESTKLYGRTVNLVAVAGHADSLLLIEKSALVARGAHRGSLGCLDGSCGKPARWPSRWLLLLLGG